MKLADGSRIAVIGGGPAGSFFSYTLLGLAERIGRRVAVDIYEPRDFSRPGPAGCNMCGGILSESLVRLLAADGIVLPPTVVQRTIERYSLHMDVGTVSIEPTHKEKRIAAVHRGGGPSGVVGGRWQSFDAHLLGLARERGATVVRERVAAVTVDGEKRRVTTKQGTEGAYDLIVGAVGVNTAAGKLFEALEAGYKAPGTTRTWIAEFFLGEETIDACLGGAMHVFILDLPGLEFAALIPKGEYVTMVLLGRHIDHPLVDAFLSSPKVRGCFPAGWTPPPKYCHCSPVINIDGAARPFADRLVLVGDSGVTRLYKDGIGSAYSTAKAAATTAVLAGVSEGDFRRHYLPVCRSLAKDNRVGKAIFRITGLVHRMPRARGGILRMAAAEQKSQSSLRRMSGVMWDTFTGSAPYRDVFRRFMNPLFLGRLAYETARFCLEGKRRAPCPPSRCD